MVAWHQAPVSEQTAYDIDDIPSCLPQVIDVGVQKVSPGEHEHALSKEKAVVVEHLEGGAHCHFNGRIKVEIEEQAEHRPNPIESNHSREPAPVNVLEILH